jgi:hypothetical protein
VKDKSSDNSFGYFFEKTPVSVDTQNISFPNSNGVFDVPMINEQNINSTNSNTPISKQPSNVNNTVSNVKKKVPNAKNINSTNSNGDFSVPIINEQNITSTNSNTLKATIPSFFFKSSKPKPLANLKKPITKINSKEPEYSSYNQIVSAIRAILLIKNLDDSNRIKMIRLLLNVRIK